MSNSNTRRFQWGVVLAWAPWIPTLVGLIYALRGIFSEKATGMAVIAGGVAESFVLLGVVAMLVAQVTAIVFLLQSFEHGRPMRSVVSVVSICLSGLSLLLMTACFGFLWYGSHRSF